MVLADSGPTLGRGRDGDGELVGRGGCRGKPQPGERGTSGSGDNLGWPHAMAVPLKPQTYLRDETASSTLGVKGNECRELIHCHSLTRTTDDRNTVFLSFPEHLEKRQGHKARTASETATPEITSQESKFI